MLYWLATLTLAVAGIDDILIVLVIAAFSAGVSTMLAPGAGKDRREEGGGVDLRENIADSAAPVGVALGTPRFLPPKVTEWSEGGVVNKLRPVEQLRRYELYHCGHGPVDGGNFKVWRGDSPIFETIGDDETKRHALVSLDAKRKRWRLPATSVLRNSVTVYIDDVVYAGGSQGVDGTFESKATTFTDARAPLRLAQERDYGGSLGYFGVTSSKFVAALAKMPKIYDDTIRSTPRRSDQVAEWRYGFYYPQQGVVHSIDKVRIGNPYSGGGLFGLTQQPTWRFGSGEKQTLGEFYFDPATRKLLRRREIVVPRADLRYATDDDGRPYVWIDVAVRVDSLPVATDFFVSYKVQRDVSLVTDVAGDVITFDTPIPDGVVSATFAMSALGEAVRVELYTGRPDQGPIETEFGGLPRVQDVDQEVTTNAVTIATKAEVDDILVELNGLSSGFFRQSLKSGDFSDATRSVEIRLRKVGAPDATTTTNDPANGWVRIAAPESDLSRTFKLAGSTRGTARFRFKIGELLQLTRLGFTTPALPQALPRARYEVRVTGLENKSDSQGTANELRWANILELVKDRFVFPNQVFLRVEHRDAEESRDRSAISVQFAGYLVKNLATGLIGPSRNPIWNACAVWVARSFGGGHFYSEASIILDEAIAAAAWQDEAIGFGDGTTGPRAQLDWWLNRRGSLLDTVTAMLAGSGVHPVPRGGRLGFVIDQDAEDVFTLDLDAVVVRKGNDGKGKEDAAKLTPLPIEQRANMLAVEYKPAPEFVDKSLPVRIGTFDARVRIVRRAEFPGVSRTKQVVHFGGLLLQQIQLNDDELTIDVVGREHLLFEVGDIGSVKYEKFKLVGVGVERDRFRITRIGFGDNLNPRITLTRVRAAGFVLPFLGPNGGVPPGTRPPSDEVDPTTGGGYLPPPISIDIDTILN